MDSIVIPVFNGAKTIRSVVEGLLQEITDAEIILVNDASEDNSLEHCRALAERYPGQVGVLDLAKNSGEHNAVMAGLNHVQGEYTVIMDDDCQHPASEVKKLFAAARAGTCDVVYGIYRKKKHAFLRNVGSRFNNGMARVLMRFPKGMYLSSFKCISRFVVDEITRYHGPFPYIDGLILRVTTRITSIPVEHHARPYGHSNYTLRRLIRLWLSMVVNFSVMPLRVSTMLGISLSMMGFVLVVLVIVFKLLNVQGPWPIGWVSMFAVFTIFSGMQLLMIGLFGEYLGKLYLTINQKPQFVVRERFGKIEKRADGHRE